MSNDAVAQWLNEAIRCGISCSVVDSKKSIGRHGKFEDVCERTRIRIKPQGVSSFLALDNGLTLQLKEVTSIEVHRDRPSSPVFRTAEKQILPCLTTVRWNQTGRQCQAPKRVHLLFSTSADTRAFAEGLGMAQRFGVGAVLAGRTSVDENAIATPSAWQVERGRELFRRRLLRWRGRRTVVDADNEPYDGVYGAADPSLVALCESPEVHIRWREALTDDAQSGTCRSATELPPDELAELIACGVPLKHRHALWRHWIANADACGVENLEADVPEAASKQIALDIPRTRPDWLQDPQRAVLSRVLRAYAARDPAIGYCQGMNFLAMVFIILGFNQDFVFAGLCHLIEKVCSGYHDIGLEGYLLDTTVLGVLVHHLLPNVHLQLEELGIPLHMIALDHFISLAARGWPVGAVARLWDLIIPEGAPAIMASFLALLEIYMPRAVGPSCEQELATGHASNLVAQDPGDVMARFKELVETGAAEELDSILSRTRRWLRAVPLELVQQLRAEMSDAGTDADP